MISESTLSQIRDRVSLFDLISEYVELKGSGKNYRGLCPFHQERSPSFFVSPERDSFHCFGCGVGGNLFHFLMRMENLSFPEAVSRLAERAGIELQDIPNADTGGAQRRQRHFELNRQSAWYYHCLLKQLPPEDPLLTYLQARHISETSIAQFYLGYCPPQNSGLKAYLLKKGFSLEEIESSTLFKGEREFFRSRLIFPIFRSDKKVVGFGGRKIHEKDQGPKYLNSPESEIFKKGELFYGLQLAKESLRKNKRALLVEGYLDVLTLHQHGLDEAIAPLGTALTPHHAKALARMAEEIILGFDQDEAGETASQRALELLLEVGRVPTRLHLEAGEDPDSFLRRYGKLALEKKLRERRNLLEELIDKCKVHVATGQISLDQKGRLAGRFVTLIEKIPDSIVRNLYKRLVSEALEVPQEWLTSGKAFQEKNRKPALPLQKQKVKSLFLPEEEVIFEIWLKFPALRNEILDKVREDIFCTESAMQLFQGFSHLAQQEPGVTTGEYFDLAPAAMLGLLSGLAVKADGLEELSEARQGLAQALLGLKKKQLQRDLLSLNANDPEELTLLQSKITDLSKVLKHRERIYGER